MTIPTVLTIGETMGLAFNAVPGSLLTSRSLTLSFGGAESNVAIGLARLGVQSRWFSKLGDDTIGRLIRRELLAEGVDCQSILAPDHRTGFMLKERFGGERASVWYYRAGSAASTLSPAELPAGLLDGVTLVHFTGISLAISDHMRESILTVIDRANGAGVQISFDVNHRDRLMPAAQAAPLYRDVAAQADFLFAGEDEARLLVDCDSTNQLTLARALSDQYDAEIILKRGSAGALTKARGGRLFEQAALAVDAVDTVGAGDAFVAGYLAERAGGKDVSAALKTATATGAHACTIYGDWEGTPTRDAVALLHVSEGVQR